MEDKKQNEIFEQTFFIFVIIIQDVKSFRSFCGNLLSPQKGKKSRYAKTS